MTSLEMISASSPHPAPAADGLGKIAQTAVDRGKTGWVFL